MPTEEFIIELFCRIDDLLGALPKHPQERMTRSELHTVGMLFALKGVGKRAFYRWFKRDYHALFPGLLERTRLFRRIAKRWEDCTAFLALPTCLGIIDTYGIETLHPYRDGRTPNQIGRKGLSNHRWIVGAKLAYILDQMGRVVGWSLMPDNVHDTTFLSMVHGFRDEMIIFGDQGFRSVTDRPENLRICKKGEWNSRMLVETVLSLLTTVMHSKKMLERTWPHVIARVASLLAVYNVLVQWDGMLVDPDGFVPIHIAEFSL